MAPKKKKRRHFTQQFRADAVQLARSSTKSIAQLARDLDLSESVLHRWVKQADIDANGGGAGPLTTEERAELARLRRENSQLRMERDFLKKASAYFAAQDQRPSR